MTWAQEVHGTHPDATEIVEQAVDALAERAWSSAVRCHDSAVNVLAFVLAPVAVAVVLFVSGWAKVGDVTGTRLAFVAMKVPAALTRPSFVRALPFAELLLGCALLLTWGWVLAVAAAATTLLFLVYAALVARVLRAGDDVECHCFGTLGDDRVTSVTLARNLVLVLLAALATGFGASGSGVVPARRRLPGLRLVVAGDDRSRRPHGPAHLPARRGGRRAARRRRGDGGLPAATSPDRIPGDGGRSARPAARPGTSSSPSC